MSTVKQKRVAQLIVENTKLDTPLNAGQIVEKSRYSKSMVIKPGVVLNSEGVKEELEVLGFTVKNAKTVVTEIMLNAKVNPTSRLKATDQVFKVLKEYGDVPPGSTFIQPIIIVYGQNDPLAKQLQVKAPPNKDSPSA